MNRQLSPFTKRMIIAFKIANLTDKQVEEQLQKIGKRGERSTITKLWNKWKQTGEYQEKRLENTRRPKSLDQEDFHELKEFIVENPDISRRKLKSRSEGNPNGLSGVTLFKYLKEEGLEQMKVRQIISISEINKQKRVQWSKNMLRGGKNELKNAIYSDETYVLFESPYYKLRWVFPQDLEGTNQNKREKQKFPKKLLIWASINNQGPLSIEFVEGNLTQDSYLDTMHQFFIEEDFINYNYSSFQQDNAQPHCSELLNNFFQDMDIGVMDWLSQSPDINPIENVWFLLKQKVYEQSENFQNSDEIKRIITQVFINDSEIKKCAQQAINSLPERLSKIILNEGQII